MPFILTRRQVENLYYDEPIGKDVGPLRMMQIPAGSFTMGSPKEELDSEDNERPQHEVTLGRFFMAKYPVTQAQWRAVAAMNRVRRELQSDPSRFKDGRHPIEQVSWYDAIEFCDRLTIHTNRQYRLPTEAEWEYACRAGTTTPFHFGETIDAKLANYRGDDIYGEGAKGEYRKKTTPVNQFEGTNTFGLVDMHGNVWEWCQDHWHENYKDAPTNGSAWLTKYAKAKHIRRGGSWFDPPRYCRSAYRASSNRNARNNGIGFRVVCSAPKVS
ncbi:hypothetical protein Lepto7375DRAFT_0916 [Leptolyngbya sp. PCC 7375]|nr:hypothetical protein Lepto7375DRAFT_0916 [Leptolyngbya sp. PCC 7375]